MEMSEVMGIEEDGPWWGFDAAPCMYDHVGCDLGLTRTAPGVR